MADRLGGILRNSDKDFLGKGILGDSDCSEKNLAVRSLKLPPERGVALDFPRNQGKLE